VGCVWTLQVDAHLRCAAAGDGRQVHRAVCAEGRGRRSPSHHASGRQPQPL